MPQTSVLPQWRADYPILTPRQKPSGILGTVSRTATAAAWASGVVTLTVPSSTDVVGTRYPMTIAGFVPAGYNGQVTGTLASATTITYPLAANPGAVTTQGTVSYRAIIPNTISTTLPATATPNKAMWSTPHLQLAGVEVEASKRTVTVEKEPGKTTVTVENHDKSKSKKS